MRQTTISKKKFIEILQENRHKHEADYNVALQERIQSATARISSLAVSLSSETPYIEENINFPLPKCHLKDYDKILRMMELEVADDITLSEQEFSMYVLDEWHWKHEFLSISQQYKEAR